VSSQYGREGGGGQESASAASRPTSTLGAFKTAEAALV